MSRAKKTATPATAAPVHALKGFNADLTCQGFQFAFGETYRHEGDVVCCPDREDLARGAGGFHAIEGHPLELFKYYPPATSRYGTVECGGEIRREEGGDSKIAAAEITVKVEMHLPELIAAAVKYVFDRAKWVEGAFATGEREGVKESKQGGAATASGDWGAATASGYRGAATASGTRGAATASGDWGAATASGTRGAATASGEQGAATASGEQGAATASGIEGAATASGYRGAATASGDQGAATASGIEGAATASGTRGAATASGRWGAATASGYRGAATASGYRGAATASGYRGAATASGIEGAATASGDQGAATASGDQGAATASGIEGAATATGYEGKARGKEGCAIFLVERSNSGEIVNVWAGIAGRDGVQPGTFYRLVDGKPVEVD